MIRKNDNLKFTIRNRTREGVSSRRRSRLEQTRALKKNVN
jgi:hypothetical protein